MRAVVISAVLCVLAGSASAAVREVSPETVGKARSLRADYYQSYNEGPLLEASYASNTGANEDYLRYSNYGSDQSDLAQLDAEIQNSINSGYQQQYSASNDYDAQAQYDLAQLDNEIQNAMNNGYQQAYSNGYDSQAQADLAQLDYEGQNSMSDEYRQSYQNYGSDAQAQAELAQLDYEIQKAKLELANGYQAGENYESENRNSYENQYLSDVLSNSFYAGDNTYTYDYQGLKNAHDFGFAADDKASSSSSNSERSWDLMNMLNTVSDSVYEAMNSVAESDEGHSTRNIAIIVTSVVAGVALLAIVAFVVWKKKSNQAKKTSEARTTTLTPSNAAPLQLDDRSLVI